MTPQENIETAEPSGELKIILNGISQLPTLPEVVNRILALVENPKTCAEDVNRIIRLDQSLTARVLKIVNSSFYGFPRQVSTVTQAVVILGFNAVKSLALSASVVNLFKNEGTEEFDVRKFWEHSICSGVFANMAGRRINYPLPEECLIAGILHGIGKLVLDQYLHDRYGEAIRRAKKEKKTLMSIEHDMFGVDHCQVGVILAEKWKLPVHLADAIRFYPAPGGATVNPTLVSLVHLGDYIARKKRCGNPGDLVIPRLSDDAKRILKLTQPDIDQMLVAADDEFDKADDLLDGLHES